MSKNNLADLNNHLFGMLEKLSAAEYSMPPACR